MSLPMPLTPGGGVTVVGALRNRDRPGSRLGEGGETTQLRIEAVAHYLSWRCLMRSNAVCQVMTAFF
jgi:hypothetical protein